MRRVGLLGAVRLFAVMLIISLLSGCAHRSEAGRAIAYATKAAEKGDGKGLQIQVDYIITMPGKARNLTKLFKNNPEAASLYLIAAAEHIDSIQYPGEVESERYSLLVLRAVNVMPESGLDSLDRSLIDRIRRGNLDGTIPFELVDSAESLALLDSPEHLEQIIKRSIKTTAESRSGPRRQINQLMRYVEKESSPAGHKKIIEDALDSLYINEQELAIVGAVFPAFAKRRGVTLASLGEDSEIEVGKSTWESLSLKERTVIEQDVRVNILADQSYGVIADIQGVDRSTAATHYGAAVGSGIAQVAYVGRALDGGSEALWDRSETSLTPLGIKRQIREHNETVLRVCG